jgi:hypothetical protein
MDSKNDSVDWCGMSEFVRKTGSHYTNTKTTTGANSDFACCERSKLELHPIIIWMAEMDD